MFHVAIDRGRVAVGRDKRAECLHQVPHRAVDHRLVGRVRIPHRPAAPGQAVGGELAFDDAFRPEINGDGAVEALRRMGQEHADALGEGGGHLGLQSDLRDVRRADLLLAFGDEDEIDRQLLARSTESVEGGEEGRLGPLLVHGAAANDDLT